jgi:7-cyano-7-deazaguanine synthase
LIRNHVVVLFSGGLDSTVAAHMALAEGRLHSVLSVYYGQPAAMWEQHAAAEWARKHGVRREILHLQLPGASALGGDRTGPRVVAGRNLVLLAHAVAYAAAEGAGRVWIGCNADDYAGYPDCRDDFLLHAALAAGAYNVDVQAPLRSFTKAGVVAKARELGVDIDATWSCYDPGRSDKACGKCSACELREAALRA